MVALMFICTNTKATLKIVFMLMPMLILALMSNIKAN